MNYIIYEDEVLLSKSSHWDNSIDPKSIPFSEVITRRYSRKTKFYYFKKKIAKHTVLFEFSNIDVDKRATCSISDVVSAICLILEAEIRNIKKIEIKRTNRLKHNIITRNTMILQEIFTLIPQEVLADNVLNQLQYVSSEASKNSRNFSQAFIRILKNASLSKAEFDIHEILEGSKSPVLDFDNHRMHKLLKLSFSSFWLDFVEKQIKIKINESTLTVKVDYKTISAVLCHILDNASKYTLKNTDLLINISLEEGYVVTEFDMISLAISAKDISKIYEEGYSGKFARELGLDGHGIGMYVVYKFIDMNNGKIEIEPNCVPRNSRNVDGVIYEQNRIKIFLPK